MSFFKHQLGNLLLGFVFWLPIGIIILIANQIYDSLDPIGQDAVSWLLPDRGVGSGTGIVFWVLVMFVTGLALKSTAIGAFATSIPIIGTFFLRKGQETMTLDRLMHLTPCVFLYSPTCLSYGWILSEQPARATKEGSPISMVNVYYPNVPTLMTGQVFAARKEAVMKLGNRSREVVDILLYGLKRPEYLAFVPWDDEDPQEFQKRADHFGLLR